VETYSQRLNLARRHYPFAKWGKSGLEQYTPDNCEAAEGILDDLILDLEDLGEEAPEPKKLKKFEKAVVALNELNDQTEGALIETGEREELCELFNQVAIQAGIDPTKYGDGEGPASEWRDW
jgi:hypothetical protein